MNYDDVMFEYIIINAEKIINDNAGRDFSIKTKDNVTVNISFNTQNLYAEMNFSENNLRLRKIDFSKKMVFGTNESAYFVSGKVFDAYDEVEKIIYFGNQYIIESYYLNVNNQRIYFRPDGPAIIFKTENGEEKKDFYLFEDQVSEEKYYDFIKKIKNGYYIKHLNKIKNKLKKTQLNLNLDFTYNIINKNIECNYLTFKKNTKEACIEIYYKSIFIGNIKLLTLENRDIYIAICSSNIPSL